MWIQPDPDPKHWKGLPDIFKKSANLQQKNHQDFKLFNLDQPEEKAAQNLVPAVR
jgi:hypothetical protein